MHSVHGIHPIGCKRKCHSTPSLWGLAYYSWGSIWICQTFRTRGFDCRLRPRDASTWVNCWDSSWFFRNRGGRLQGCWWSSPLTALRSTLSQNRGWSFGRICRSTPHLACLLTFTSPYRLTFTSPHFPSSTSWLFSPFSVGWPCPFRRHTWSGFDRAGNRQKYGYCLVCSLPLHRSCHWSTWTIFSAGKTLRFWSP